MVQDSSGFSLSFAGFLKTCHSCPDDSESLASLWQLLSPRICWKEGRITEKDAEGLTIDTTYRIKSAYLAAGLAHCDQVTVMGVTVGDGISQALERHQKAGEFYRASLADLVGSYGVEQLADRFCVYLQNQALPRGRFQTLRYSPGYGDWPLEGQRDIMTYLENCHDAIRLTTHCMLQPEKSVTALVGWASFWQKPEYPQGDRKSGFCGSGNNCAACTTWACRKDRGRL